MAVAIDEVKARIRSAIQGVLAPEPVTETSRSQLLALSELVRRVEGDLPAALDLARHELKVFSQNGEDGVLTEIVRRSGAPGRYFVEFGTGPGVECNCALLATVLNWSGLFMEASEAEYAGLERKYRGLPQVRTRRTMVTPGNIEALLAEHDVPREPDVLSIDVDGSDFWIWEALESYRPRIVVIEYNGSLPPGRRLVQPRDRGPYEATDYYGASIDALVALGSAKGYRFVHCDLTGNNAFFVRTDLPGDYLEPDAVPRRAANLWLQGVQHTPDAAGRTYVDLDQAHNEP
jgi:hypothetical protein